MKKQSPVGGSLAATATATAKPKTKWSLFHPQPDHAPYVFAFYLRRTPKAKPQLKNLLVAGCLEALVLQAELAKRLHLKPRQIEIACYTPKPEPDPLAAAAPELLAALRELLFSVTDRKTRRDNCRGVRFKAARERARAAIATAETLISGGSR